MKFKKIALLVSLVTVLSGLSLWAMDDDVVVSDAAAQRLALVSQVGDLLARGEQVFALASTSHKERKGEYLELSFQEFEDARGLIKKGFLDLTGADGQLLVARLYSAMGNAYQEMVDTLPPCMCVDCPKKQSIWTKSAKAYFMASLASADQATFRGGLGTLKPAVATIMERFDTVYAECVVDTDLTTHVGVKTRFDRFNAKLTTARPRVSQSSSGLPPQVLQVMSEVEATGGRAMVIQIPRSLLTSGANGAEFMALMQATSGASGVGIRMETLQAMLVQLRGAPGTDEGTEE